MAVNSNINTIYVVDVHLATDTEYALTPVRYSVRNENDEELNSYVARGDAMGFAQGVQFALGGIDGCEIAETREASEAL